MDLPLGLAKNKSNSFGEKRDFFKEDLVVADIAGEKPQAQASKASNTAETNNTAQEIIQEFSQTKTKFNFQAQEICLKSKFWYIVFILLFIPIVKSGIINFSSLVTNFGQHGKLKSIKTGLENDKKNIQAKIRNYHSHSGMKRTIKEEIKVIEKNEILIRLAK